VPGDYPDFGYYFLRLASDRLLQNNAHLEGIIEQDKVKLPPRTHAEIFRAAWSAGTAAS
jgi:hypothetical protein